MEQQVNLFEESFHTNNPTENRSEQQTKRKVAYDVGEEITGSRKSEAALRKLFTDKKSASLLDEIEENSAELAAELISKKELFADFSLESEKEKGVDVKVARLKQLLIQRIDSQPSDNTKSRKDYFHAIQELKVRFNTLDTWDSFSAFIDKMNTQLILESSNPRLAEETLTAWKNQLDQTDKSDTRLLHQLNIKVKRYERRLKNIEEAKKYHFRVLGKSFYNFFTKQASINSTLKTVSELNSWDELLKAKTKKRPGKKNKPVWERDLPERPDRNGGRPSNVASPDDMMRAFNFRGIQFGNYVNDNKGLEHIYRCSEAFQDLADILNTSDFDISLNANLALAFGARGRGKALAHYEPRERVINFTKERGTLGVTAHEWFHALDHYLYAHSHSHKNGQTGFLSDLEGIGPTIAGDIKAAMENLMEEIKHGKSISHFKNENKENIRWNIPRFFKQAYEESEGDLLGCMTILSRDIQDRFETKIKMLSFYNYTSKENEITKLERKRAKELKKTAQALAWYHEQETGERVETIPYPDDKSNFFQQAISLDRNKEGKYWSSNRELMARAFEAWVEDKLNASDRRSDYLVCGTHDAAAYPSFGERKKINEKIDAFVANVTKYILF